MIQFTIQQFKEGFFNSADVAKFIEPGVRRSLGKAGGYLRRVARNSLKYDEGKSAPGQPPKVHQFFNRRKTNRKTGQVTIQSVSPLRELLFFAYDRESQTTIVGPARFPGAKAGNLVPRTLEKGGTVRKTITEPQPRRASRPATGRQREAFLRKVKDGSIIVTSRTVTKTITKRHAARPFMGPALDRTLPRFAGYFRNSAR